MGKKKPAREPVNAAILVHMTRGECDLLHVLTPAGMTTSTWCRQILVEAAGNELTRKFSGETPKDNVG